MADSRSRVAILDDYQGVALQCADWTALPSDIAVDVFRDPIPEEAVPERLRPFQIVVAMRERTPFPRASLQQLPNLRLLATTGMRNKAIDLEAAREFGITVCGTDVLPYPTVELTWGLILALCRRIPQENRSVLEGGWQTGLGVGLQGKTLGILGLGRLGRQVAHVGKAFGMHVTAWSRNLTRGACDSVGVAYGDRDELLSAADIVTVHLLLSERTRGLIGAAEFGLMKPTAYLVNTSRGSIVDETALIQALRSGRIAGAAIDVFDREPLPHNDPLRKLKNALLTPHIGYVTQENYRLFFGQTVENIAAFLLGAPIRVLN